jgi:hypothetical protein
MDAFSSVAGNADHQRGTLDAVGRGHPPHQNPIKALNLFAGGDSSSETTEL